jgi:hypothetical protein
MRKGSECSAPPMNVPSPVMAAADDGIAAAGDRARVRQALREGHADPCADGRREPREERDPGYVRSQGDGEDRRQRRQRTVDQAAQRGLRALEEKASLV